MICEVVLTVVITVMLYIEVFKNKKKVMQLCLNELHVHIQFLVAYELAHGEEN